MACPFGFLNSMYRNPRSMNCENHISKQNRDEPTSPPEYEGIQSGVFYPRLIINNHPPRPFQGPEPSMWPNERARNPPAVPVQPQTVPDP